MRRALTIVLVAVLAGMLSGVESASQILSDGDGLTEQRRRLVIATRLNAIAIGYIVTIVPADGGQFRAAFVGATPEAITFVRLGDAPVGSESMPLEEIAQVDREGRRIVSISRRDGRTTRAALVSATPDSLTVSLLDRSGAQETIPLDEIVEIEEVRGSTLRKILIGIGVGVGVCTVISIAVISSLELE